MGRLQDKVALITGSGSGIGRATAVLFAREGARITVNDINERSAQETVKLIRETDDDAMSFKADVTVATDVRRMIDHIIMKYGRIDILHNNVGAWMREPRDTVTEDSETEWDRLIALNLKGTFLVSKEVVPHMMKQRSGSIINTITTDAYMPYVGNESYTAAKGAVRELTRAMCLDYARYGIRVNGIAPGETRTPGWEASAEAASNPEEAREAFRRRIPMGRLAEPEDIALGALFLASDDARYVNGHVLFVDGGLTAGFY